MSIRRKGAMGWTVVYIWSIRRKKERRRGRRRPFGYDVTEMTLTNVYAFRHLHK